MQYHNHKKALKKDKTKPLAALVLSGGGSRGAYQCGAFRAISELGIKIDIVVGVSVGALNGAMVVQKDMMTALDLWRSLETDKVFDLDADAGLSDFALEFLKQGGASTRGLKSYVDKYIDEDKIRSSDIDFGILTVEIPGRIPHYLWKEDIPTGQIGDFIMASSSAFPALQPYTIDGKTYIDGGYEDNLPIAMARRKDAKNIIAVYLDAPGVVEKASLSSENNLTLIKPTLDLGNFLTFNQENIARIIRLGYLDAMKAFGVYEGPRYSFVRGDFDRDTLPKADAAAGIFELDPLILYRKESFIQELLDEVLKVTRDTGEVKKWLDELNSHNINLDRLRFLKENINRKTLVIHLAKEKKSGGISPIFSLSGMKKLLSEEIDAADFLITCGFA
jgi:NTE family protein